MVAKKTAGGATAARAAAASAVPAARAVATAAPGELPVRPGEDPWTPEEVAEARNELTSEVLRLRSEIAASEAALAGLMRDSGDGAGDDDADTGTKNITREHEMALAANARETLEQTEHALERLDAGTYGVLRGLRQADRQGPHAGVPARHPVRGGQAEAGTAGLTPHRCAVPSCSVRHLVG